MGMVLVIVRAVGETNGTVAEFGLSEHLQTIADQELATTGLKERELEIKLLKRS